MLDALQGKRQLYPLAAFAATLGTLITGMLHAKSGWIFAFLGALVLLFCAFGLYRAVLSAVVGVGAFGCLIGGVACLINRDAAVFLPVLARWLLLGVCVVPMLSVPVAALSRALNRLHCPRALTLGMMITVRFLPVFFGEMKQIHDAMRTRGLRAAWADPRVVYRAFLIPLIMRVINIADTLSLSVETRGFDLASKETTVFRPVRFGLLDGVFLGLTAAVCIGLGVLA